MEGQSILSDKLSFIENRTKFKAGNNVGSGKLITAANQHGLFYIGFEDKTIKAVKIEDIVEPNNSSSQVINIDRYTFSANLSFKPYLLSVARHGYSSILLVAGKNDQLNCPSIEFFDLDSQASIGRVDLSEFSNSTILDYAWQPVYYESIVAICLSSGHLLIVAVDKKEKRVGVVYKEQKSCLTCCWSPKGKNLAIGMTNGQVRRLEIGQLTQGSTTFSFKDVDKSVISFTHLTPDYQARKLRWINKKYLMCAHARPTDPTAVFSIFTIKPTEPCRYFTNVCVDTISPDKLTNYNVDLLNLSGVVICTSNASGDVSVIGVAGAEQFKKNDIADWNMITIDAEGARIELPLDSDNCETYSRGVVITFAKKFGNNPVLVFYTNDGLICSYVAAHSEQILKLPEVQKLENCPITVPKPSVTFADQRSQPFVSAFGGAARSPAQNHESGALNLGLSMGLALNQPFQQQQAPLSFASVANSVAPTEKSLPPVEKPADNMNTPIKSTVSQTVEINFHDFSKEIATIKQGIEFNETFLSVLDEINHLRTQFDEIQDIHKTHKEVLDAVREDIEALDIGMLENLYLIEYIKSRGKGGARKKSLDPMTLKKVETIKHKSKLIAEKLKDLNNHVDVSWEDFCRRRTATANKTDRRLNSLDMIYKTLATNQKIINFLKKKSAHLPVTPATPKSLESQCSVARRDLDPARMRALKEFLASRNTVPVRRPETVKQTSRSRI